MKTRLRTAIRLAALYAVLSAPAAHAQFLEEIDLGTLSPPDGIILESSIKEAWAGLDVAGLGDVNGDGFDDVAIGAHRAPRGMLSYAGRVYVLFGGPGVPATSPVDLESLDGATGFAILGLKENDQVGVSIASAGDVNGDGYRDILVAGDGVSAGINGEAYVIYGGPAVGATGGIDLAALSPSVGARLFGYVTDGNVAPGLAGIGDINCDGVDDAAVGAPMAGAPPPVLSAPKPLTCVRAGDLSMDGFGDVILTSRDWDKYTVFYNSGKTFMALTFPLLDGPSFFTLDDIDLDGDLDMVVATKEWDEGLNKIVGHVVTKRNFGNGLLGFELIEFTGEQETCLATGDVDGDGDHDIAVGHYGQTTTKNLSILYNDAPNPPPPAASFTLLGRPHAVVLTDLDGDQDLDAAVAQENPHRISLFRNNGFGAFMAGPHITLTLLPTLLQAADLDGNQSMDLCCVAGGKIQILLNKGTWSFFPAVTYDPDADPADLVLLDTDGDGDSDVLTGNGGTTSKHLTLLRNNGNGTLATPVAFHAGGDIASMGVTDVNGDGLLDVAAGLDGTSDVALLEDNGAGVYSTIEAGATYVVFGGTADLASGQVDLSTLDGQNGFILDGTPGLARFGKDVAGAGDFNGDGMDDMVIGAPQEITAATHDGAAYVVFGGPGIGTGGSLDVSSLGPAQGLRFLGVEEHDDAGYSVAGAGDVNGDGLDDVLVGLPFSTVNGVDDVGRAAVLFGTTAPLAGGSLTVADLDGTNGFVVLGENEYDTVGYRVSGAGDVNGDGFADIVIGTRYIHFGGISFGGAALVYGAPQVGASGSIKLGSLHGVFGTVLKGANEGDHAGWGVAGAGDLNQDGFADVIVGAPWADPKGLARAGSAYVLFGRQRSLSADVATLTAATGGTQTLSLDAGQVNAGMKYFLLGSYSGTEPGLPVGSVVLPLNLDAYLLFTASYPNTPLLSGSLGALDADGKATASFNLPAGLPIAVDLTLRHAYVLLTTTNEAVFASNQIPLFIQP
ncbi:MAG: FG-GAP repeat protein [Planctomycetes bacterium]|nr:FG-GAP repeat protein [Planctomycetota bacterium]